jgi:hypothetical protein
MKTEPLEVMPSSLSDLKEIGCKSVWLVYISPLFRPIEQLLAFKIVKIYPHPVTFSLRFFKSDRLLAVEMSIATFVLNERDQVATVVSGPAIVRSSCRYRNLSALPYILSHSKQVY